MLTGWTCPECGKVNAPWVRECPYAHYRIAYDIQTPLPIIVIEPVRESASSPTFDATTFQPIYKKLGA